MFAAFSPDGMMIGTACNQDATPRLWNAQTGQLRATLAGHSAGVTRPIFSPDGRRLATAGPKDNVLLWEITTETAGLRK